MKQMLRGTRASVHLAALQGSLNILSDLLQAGAEVDAKNKAGYTAVALAKDTHTIEVLKAGGATMPKILDQERDALLMKYAEEGCAGGVLMALKAGATVNHKDSVLNKHLHYAAGAGRLSVVQALVSAGAELTSSN